MEAHIRIDRVLLRTLRLELRAPFRTAAGETRTRTVLLARVEGDGLEGWAECVAPATPHYTAETLDTARAVLRRYLIPAVLGRSFEGPSAVGAALEEAVRGHPMARATLEMAAWDAEARSRGVPLAHLLAALSEAPAETVPTAVPVGVSVGMVEEGTLLERIDEYVGRGYRRVKLKVGPDRDVGVLEAVRRRFPSLPLTVDANGSYDPHRPDGPEALDEFGLLYIEQPYPADELVAHARLQARMDTPLCLDESITGPGSCRTALALGAARVINVKPGRVGGHGAALAIHDLCEAAGVPVWCGGMLEAGVGRAHNVALATLPNMRFPGDISASDRYWERDIVTPAFELGEDGTIPIPAGPGIGVELDEDYIRAIEVDRTEFH